MNTPPATNRERVLALYKSHLPKAVLGFFEEHRPLSNFHLEDFEWESITWSSSEAAYQAAKWPREKWPELARLPPGAAKSKGREAKVDLRLWELRKVDVMKSILRAKFDRCPIARACLLSTGAARLEECNWWGDTFWGTVDGYGKNQLGAILMDTRDRIYSRMESSG